jgi:hypothetical protein
LTNLDGEAIKHLEQADADKWMRGGLYEYYRIKHENRKNNESDKTMVYFHDFHQKHINTIEEMKKTSGMAQIELNKQIAYRQKLADKF